MHSNAPLVNDASTYKVTIDHVVEQICQVILGKEQPIRLALACLLARGHLLIEDLPGVGKTTLAHTIAKALGLHYSRIQFTSDLLPADILGASIYNRETGGFVFHPGPIFAQLVLADEVNRATPKAQSALLEAMEERQVSLEGETRPLPSPFFVIATQNPSYQIGTFALPESQLDRFLMQIKLGYPDAAAERALLTGVDRRQLLQTLQPSLTLDRFSAIQEQVNRQHCSEALLEYIQSLLQHSRSMLGEGMGLSPRAGLALLHSAQAWSLMEGRTHVLPDDVQIVLPQVVGHRLRTLADQGGGASDNPVTQLLQVPIP